MELPLDQLLGPYGLLVGCVFGILWLIREKAKAEAARDAATRELIALLTQLADKAGGTHD